MSLSIYDHTVKLKTLYKAIARGDEITRFFPNGLSDDLEGRENVAVAEIADRDSVAAVLKVMKEGEIKEILPIADIIPPEHGNIRKGFNQVFWLKEKAKKYNVKIYDLMFIESYDLYSTLAARYSRELINRYGFYTPCIACHMYFHTIRVPIVKALGGTQIIGGERNSHDGRLKPSQIPIAIDYYKKAVGMLGGNLVLPLRDIVDTNEIIKLTYDDHPQLSCMFKETYGGLPESIMRDEERLKGFLEEFALPLTLDLIGVMVRKENPNIIGLADKFVERLTNE